MYLDFFVSLINVAQYILTESHNKTLRKRKGSILMLCAVMWNSISVSWLGCPCVCLFLCANLKLYQLSGDNLTEHPGCQPRMGMLVWEAAAIESQGTYARQQYCFMSDINLFFIVINLQAI